MAKGRNEMARVAIISMWMPWAQWVMLGWKTTETRKHKRLQSLAGKRIGIHAANKWDDDALELARPYLTAEQLAYTKMMPLKSGVIGTVSVTEHRALTAMDAPSALIECISIQRYGLFLENPAEWTSVLPMKGKQGIWYADI